MLKRIKRIIFILFLAIVFIALAVALFTVFFDQAIIARRDTIYRVSSAQKIVALTFDDGPSPDWTPKILDALKEEHVLKGHHSARDLRKTYLLDRMDEDYKILFRIVAGQGQVESGALWHAYLLRCIELSR